MKELTIEAKAKAYDEALERAKDMLSYKEVRQEDIEYLFPELKESKDERIRKELIEHIKASQEADYVLFKKFSPDDVIAWLEKQKSVEEIVSRCKKSWYNEGKIDGMAEGLTDDEKYQQGWHDAIKKQGEKPQGKSEIERVRRAIEAIKEKPVDNANKVASAWNNGYSNGYIQAIDKACEWLENHNDYIDVKDGNVTYFDMGKCVKDFSKYMRGGEG